MKYTIDAKDKKLGRVATEAAALLIGKNLTTFKRNAVPDVQVEVINAASLDIAEKKREQKAYPWFSGYPGGLRFEKFKDALEKKGIGDILRRTVDGMLPKNKLRSRMIKNLTITE
jgi:large subunit ribosomal protein L13